MTRESIIILHALNFNKQDNFKALHDKTVIIV